jgi:hypothetical protein
VTVTRYGSKYIAGLDKADIAKAVRADIKAAVAAGTLPEAKYSVRISRFAGGSSITVKVADLPGRTFTDGWLKGGHGWLLKAPATIEDGEIVRPSKYTRAANATLDALKEILAAYNFDGSDSSVDYFHVNFYAHVDLDSKWEHSKEAVERACLANDEMVGRVLKTADLEWAEHLAGF